MINSESLYLQDDELRTVPIWNAVGKFAKLHCRPGVNHWKREAILSPVLSLGEHRKYKIKVLVLANEYQKKKSSARLKQERLIFLAKILFFLKKKIT